MTSSATKVPIREGARTDSLRILLVDDHALFAAGVSLILAGLGERVQVTWAQSCEGALDEIAAGKEPDLILFDLALPGVHHVEAFQLVQHRLPLVPIVAVSADERPRVIGEMLRAGARGYVPKSTSAEIMLSALRLVLAGGTYVPAAALADTPSDPLSHGLTPRELDVLELLVHGHGNKQIATQLGMAESTVRVHVTSIMRRLGVRSRVEVATSPSVARLIRRPAAGR